MKQKPAVQTSKVSIKSSLPLRSAPCLCATGTRRPFQRFADSKGRFSPAGSVGVQRLPLASNTLWRSPQRAEFLCVIKRRRVEKTSGRCFFVGNPRRGFPGSEPHVFYCFPYADTPNKKIFLNPALFLCIYTKSDKKTVAFLRMYCYNRGERRCMSSYSGILRLSEPSRGTQSKEV